MSVPLLGLVGRAAAAAPTSRVRPGDAAWPGPEKWKQLADQVGAALVEVRSPFAECIAAPTGSACTQLFAKTAKNPYALGDDLALTQTFGWVDAWTSSPSVYAVAARNTADVVAAVNFARRNALRLVVKGGGHSYQGTSNAADSLLVWTRRMNAITLHDAFVAQGCATRAAPVRAVSVGAGAIWAHVYDAVTTQAGGYVQGGGCMTVGVAGLIQSGGFGSFSKQYGLAAASLLEAEVVTADGEVRIVNACSHPDLFWALKGGGGASFGVVTRLTLRVHPLPEDFGAVNMTIKAASPAAFRKLVGVIVDFCAEHLVGPHWGEQIRFFPNNVLGIAMVFQGLTRGQAQAVWRPFMDAVDAGSDEWKLEFSLLKIVSTSAREFWAPTFIKRTLGFISRDDRPGAPPTNVFWPGDQGQAGPVPARLQLDLAPRDAAATGAPRRAGRCALRGEPALARLAAPEQGPRRRAGRRAGRSARHGDEPGRPRCLLSRDPRRRRAAGVSGRRRPRARRRRGALAQAGDRAGGGGAAEARAGTGVLRRGERLLRGGLAERLLGRELCAPDAGERQVRRGEAVPGAPRGGERAVEGRSILTIPLAMSRNGIPGAAASPSPLLGSAVPQKCNPSHSCTCWCRLPWNSAASPCAVMRPRLSTQTRSDIRTTRRTL